MLRALAISFVLAQLAGCAQYFYSARKPNADGRGHEALASWSVTERALWFDESSETVRVTLQCGKTIPFQQREDGIYVLYDPTIWSEPRTIGDAQYCGRVEGATELSSLAVGQALRVELWCQPVQDDEGFTIDAPSLPAGSHTFGAVQRTDRAPAVAPCPTTSESTLTQD
ncbi:MAG TPA: hypothetical protein VJV78_00485 [Polyangiales bacterium]|nr:hypothetical protein [Polyangiales bacterium]